MMANADDSGTCGTNLTWTYVEATHTLTISGEGSMANYSSNTMPWYPYRKEMTKVIIENGVTSIGDHAFGYCNDLTSITIPNSVSSIGSFAFRNCSGLTSITIPNSVTSIGNYAFSNCSGLTSITIPNSVTGIGDFAFNNCSGLTSVTIPNSVTNIGESAFGYCSGLTSITIPNSVTSIGSSAFAWCSGLTSIIIPNGVTSIGDYAFDWCSGLTSITIPSSVTSIGYRAFTGCSSLTSIHVSDLAWWCNINISDSGLSDRTRHLYLGDHEVTDLLIPDGVTTINSCSFKNCAYLTSITIPNSVTTIGEQAFSGCNRVKTLKLPDNLRLIRPSTFSGCSGLESVTIPPTVEVIYQNAFNGCYSLESVTAQATTPPFAYDNSFSNYNIPLYVPETAVESYKTTNPWSKFAQFKTLNGADVEVKKCEKPTIRYENGEINFSCETEGVEFVSSITDSDIKDYNVARIPLNVTYMISVHATKAGYEDSDVATATLCWIDKEPSTEGITSIAQIRAKAIMIQNYGNVLTIQGADENTPISVYEINGTLAGTGISRDGTATVTTNLRPSSIAIVKIGDKSVKVMMK